MGHRRRWQRDGIERTIVLMDIKENSRPPFPKIGQLVDDAKTELKRVGIETVGKRSDEILKMAREERNKPRVA